MDSIENRKLNDFFTILRAAVNNQPLSGTEEKSLNLTSGQWKELIDLARAQDVFPIMVETVSQNRSFMNAEGYVDYLISAMSVITVQVQNTQRFLSLYQKFIQNGYHPIVMKGLICRQLYGELGDHRPSGDEDILIKKEEFASIRELLIREGFYTEKESYTPEELDEVQAITFHGEGGMRLEVHINPVGVESQWRSRLNECFRDAFENVREVEINGISVRTLNHTMHLLFLIIHAFKHFVGSQTRFRQILDVLLYIRQYGAECDWKYLQEALDKVRVDSFLYDILSIGNKYLGLDLRQLGKCKCPDELLDGIISSGQKKCGTKTEVTAGILTQTAMTGHHTGIRLKTLLSYGFPPKEKMLKRYPYLCDKPWLLPWCWISRWHRFWRENDIGLRKLIIQSRKISRKKIQLLKKYRFF